MRIRGLAVVLTALAVVSTACGDTGSSGSSDGASLVVYSGRNENLVKPLLDRFSKASGIDVEVKYGGSAELAAQLVEEGAKTPASVFFSQDAGALGALQDADLLAPLSQQQLDVVPSEFRSKTGHWVGVSGRSRVLVYNKDLVTEAALPASVFALTDPKYKGKIGLAPTNASFQAFVSAMRLEIGDDRTRQFLQRIIAAGRL